MCTEIFVQRIIFLYDIKENQYGCFLLKHPVFLCVSVRLHSCSCDVKFVQERGVMRLREVASFDFLLPGNYRSSQMNAEVDNDVDPKY